ncbi:DUF2933 domain-containing protein [Candidatus Woesearchaeota archaeon]|nr:DUF2933 domain-containing protein [Candidatus Woesearchaeota archaeon]
MNKAAFIEALKKHHHKILMLVCIIPIIIWIMVGFSSGFKQSYLVLVFLLLCPLMHIWMMKEMHKGKETKDEKDSSNTHTEHKEGGSSCH